MENLVETVFDAVSDAGYDRDTVRFIYLFGSPVETPEQANDIDIAVSMDVEDPDQADYRLKGRVPDNMDIAVFETVPLQVQNQVFKGDLLYKRDKSVYDIAMQTFRAYESFESVYKAAIGDG